MPGRYILFAIGIFCIYQTSVFAAEDDLLAQPTTDGLDRYLVTPASNGGSDPYVHNGSDMVIEQRGTNLHIRYDKPRAALASAGIKPGSLLFAGHRIGDKVEGIAYLFNAKCPPAPYVVTGQFDSTYNLVLNGPAPLRDPQSCAVIAASGAARQARLVFSEAFGDF
jgi:hypothetical protein